MDARRAKTITLAETQSCPLCNSRMVQDNRLAILDMWYVTRTYACGTLLGGTIGTPLYIEVPCARSKWLRKVA